MSENYHSAQITLTINPNLHKTSSIDRTSHASTMAVSQDKSKEQDQLEEEDDYDEQTYKKFNSGVYQAYYDPPEEEKDKQQQEQIQEKKEESVQMYPEVNKVQLFYQEENSYQKEPTKNVQKIPEKLQKPSKIVEHIQQIKSQDSIQKRELPFLQHKSTKTSPIQHIESISQKMSQQENQHVSITFQSLFDFPLQKKATITGYQKQYFLKIQTQIYDLQVLFKKQTLKLNRKFTDFANLHRIILSTFPGIILYPFPSKSIQFFTVAKFSYGSQRQKITLIQKRLLQLQNYTNFIVCHPQISKSQILSIFFQQSQNVFTYKMTQILQKVDEQQDKMIPRIIQKHYASIKKVLITSFNYFGASIQSNKSLVFGEIKAKSENLQQILIKYEEKVKKYIETITSQNARTSKLIELYQKQYKISQSDLDSVLKLGSKLNSSKSYLSSIRIEIQTVDQIQKLLLDFFNQIHSELIKYKQILTQVENSDESNQLLCSKILQRVSQFINTFEPQWDKFNKNTQTTTNAIYMKIRRIWSIHSKSMCKIWR